MSRMNNKGFLLAESLIVSTFVLTVLIFLFVQFKNLMVNHKKSYTYNSVENIYDLGSLADYFKANEISNSALKNALNAVGNDNNIEIYNQTSGCLSSVLNDGTVSACNTLAETMDLDYVLYTDSDIDNIDLSKINYQDMRDFIDKINATKIKDKGRLFAKFKNGNFATIAMEQKVDITIPTRTVIYDFGNGNNMNWWSKLYGNEAFTITYNSATKMNTIDVKTVGGWEQLYMPLRTIAGQTYTVQFDYKLDTALTPLDANHQSLAYQFLAENNDPDARGTELSASDHQSESTLHILTRTLPTTINSSGTITINFTAKADTMMSYLVFNFGYLSDNKTYKVELGNFKIVENVTGRNVYGPMLSPMFGQVDSAYAPSPQPIVNPHNFRGWFDEIHKDQNNNQIQIKETTSISPSLFTDNKQTVIAHFD